MNHHRMRRLGGVFLASLVAVSFATVARAEDRHAWFEGLTMPGTAIPCCDISDCRRTKADWRGGQWWATVDGQWTPIPPEQGTDQTLDRRRRLCLRQPQPLRLLLHQARPDDVAAGFVILRRGEAATGGSPSGSRSIPSMRYAC